MVIEGETGKLIPLVDVPIFVPPVAVGHHVITLPVDIPFKFEVPAMQYDEGVAVAVGEAIGATVTITEILIALIHGL